MRFRGYLRISAFSTRRGEDSDQAEVMPNLIGVFFSLILYSNLCEQGQEKISHLVYKQTVTTQISADSPCHAE